MQKSWRWKNWELKKYSPYVVWWHLKRTWYQREKWDMHLNCSLPASAKLFVWITNCQLCRSTFPNDQIMFPFEWGMDCKFLISNLQSLLKNIYAHINLYWFIEKPAIKFLLNKCETQFSFFKMTTQVNTEYSLKNFIYLFGMHILGTFCKSA